MKRLYAVLLSVGLLASSVNVLPFVSILGTDWGAQARNIMLAMAGFVQLKAVMDTPLVKPFIEAKLKEALPTIKKWAAVAATLFVAHHLIKWLRPKPFTFSGELDLSSNIFFTITIPKKFQARKEYIRARIFATIQKQISSGMGSGVRKLKNHTIECETIQDSTDKFGNSVLKLGFSPNDRYKVTTTFFGIFYGDFLRLFAQLQADLINEFGAQVTIPTQEDLQQKREPFISKVEAESAPMAARWKTLNEHDAQFPPKLAKLVKLEQTLLHELTDATFTEYVSWDFGRRLHHMTGLRNAVELREKQDKRDLPLKVRAAQQAQEQEREQELQWRQEEREYVFRRHELLAN